MTDEADGLIRAMDGARVLVVGDVMLDRFVTGTVDRISPEAPIPVLRVTGRESMPGAAGNVAANLVALGATARLIGVIGADDGGRQLQALLDARPGIEASLVVEPARPTTLKTRFTAGGQQLLRADEETSEPVSAATAATLLGQARRAADAAGAIILSDYGKGVLTTAVLRGLLDRAGPSRPPVVVDPKGRDWARYAGATVLTPNRRELAEATGRPTGTDAEVTEAARAAFDLAGVEAMVVTRSEQGISVVGRTGAPLHFRGQAREVFDVSGAGDTVVAVLAAALATGGSIAAAARLANLAGGLVVGKAGTAVVEARELSAALHLQEWVRGEAKLADLAEAGRRVRQWREQGWRIGFTNGCFDLLHPGHVALLRQARQACDRLVVGLNTDESVRRLKGPDRPVQSELARAAVLASLQAVDLVVLFGEETPLALIEALRPDVLVKGADYTVATVVGADFVQGYGGRVLLAMLEPGYSTTATIRRLQG